jgi:two-component system LytT family response regulator
MQPPPLEPLRCVIVDNETTSRRMLRTIVTRYFPDARVTAEADSVASAVDALRGEQPDVLFLDLDLGDETGFDVLDRLGARSFHVIFTTAYTNFDARARACPRAFLLHKPLAIADVRNVLDRIRSERSL